MNNHNGWWKLIFQKKIHFHQKIPKMSCVKFWWKVTSTWCYHCSCKLVALKLHNSCSYIVVIKLLELHIYIVSYIVSYICYNACDLSNSTHTRRNMLSCKWSLQPKNPIPNPIANHPIFSFFFQCKISNIIMVSNKNLPFLWIQKVEGVKKLHWCGHPFIVI
jgi:hypothetical protein